MTIYGYISSDPDNFETNIKTRTLQRDTQALVLK